MSHAPLLSGGIIVEVDKREYEELIRASEKIATAERYLNERGYITESDVKAILGIERKES